MRSFAFTIFLIMTCVANLRAAAPKPLDRGLVSTTGYLRLDPWADSCGYKLRWDKKSGWVELAGRNVRINFLVNSRKAQINGETVLFSLPVLARGDMVLIPAIDAQTTLQPILFPQRNPAWSHVRTVCIDPGHGGKDTGKIDKGNQEKKYTLLLAQDVAGLLASYDVKVVLTRAKDQTLELADRPAFARRKGADLFISLHYNAAGSDVRGVEVFCLTPAGMASSNEGGGRSDRHAYPGNAQNAQNVLLANLLQKNIRRTTALEDRGLKRSRFEVLREAQIPAVLIEGGFMTNPSDAKKIYDPAFRKKMAQAIVDGIIAYKRIVERP